MASLGLAVCLPEIAGAQALRLPQAPVPSFGQEAFNDAATAINWSPNVYGVYQRSLEGSNAMASAVDLSEGAGLIFEIYIDINKVIAAAGIDPTSNDPDDQRALELILELILDHENGHANGSITGAPCDHQTAYAYYLDVFCDGVIGSEQDSEVKQKLCDWYERRARGINQKVYEECSGPSPAPDTCVYC